MIYLRPQDVVEIIMRVSAYVWLMTLRTTKFKDTRAGIILPDFATLA